MRDVIKLCAVGKMKQRAYLRGTAASRLAAEGVGQRRRSRLSPSLGGRGWVCEVWARSGHLPVALSDRRCGDRRALLGVADGVPGAAP